MRWSDESGASGGGVREAIVAAMLADGWRLGSNADYRPDLALDTAQLFEFIGDTQVEAVRPLQTSVTSLIGCPVTAATVWKSWSSHSTVSRSRSAVAAMSRSTGPAERCSPDSVSFC